MDGRIVGPMEETLRSLPARDVSAAECALIAPYLRSLLERADQRHGHWSEVLHVLPPGVAVGCWFGGQQSAAVEAGARPAAQKENAYAQVDATGAVDAMEVMPSDG